MGPTRGQLLDENDSSGDMLVLEMGIGLPVALVVFFFLLKDGDRLAAAALRLVHPERADRHTGVDVRAMGLFHRLRDRR